jgi:glycosyltransferase involved in cell wall biosynthesis
VREHARAAASHADVAVLHLERTSAARGVLDVVRIPGEEPPTWRVRYRRFPRPASYAAFFAGPLVAARWLGRAGWTPDVIHAHSALSALPALALGRVLDLPVAYTEHWGVFLQDDPPGLTRAMRLVARTALERADVVLPVSAELAEALRRIAPRARRRVLPNAVDERVFHPDRARPSGGPGRLVTAGLLDSDGKGVDVLLEALARLDHPAGVRLDVVGDGARRPHYERLAQRLGLAETVRFHGLRRKPELAALMREADLFVLGSRADNSPCVLLEAMATGLPVVATRVGGVPELVGADAGLLVDPGDAESLAAGIGTALARLDEFDRTQIARRVHHRYGHGPVGRKLAQVYDSLTAP